MSLTLPVLSSAEASQFENLYFAGDSAKVRVAMRRAGSAVAEAILQDYKEIGPFPPRPSILVIAGKGHNAGDALYAASHILKTHPEASLQVVLAEPRNTLKPLALEALQILEEKAGDGLNVTQWSSEIQLKLENKEWDLAIDGLLGQAFKSPLRHPYSDILIGFKKIQSTVRMRASIDVPSGLELKDTKLAFPAHFTYITGLAKKHLFESSNNEWVGRLQMLNLGFFKDNEEQSTEHLVLRQDAHQTLGGLRSHLSYKGTMGHLMLLGGSKNMPGAILMSAQAAVRAGAGLTTVMTPDSIQPFLAPHLPEAIWQPLMATEDGSFDPEIMRVIHVLAANASAMVIGPGMLRDRQNVFIVCRIIREVALPLILDASALSSDCLNALLGRPLNYPKVILTPHIGEYIRLRGGKGPAYDRDEFRSFCQKFSIIGVLKGHITQISDGERVIEAPVGGPVLARGGTGDILAGIIGSVLARQPDAPLKSVLQAVAWHGAAADLLARAKGQVAVKSTEVLDFLSSALR